MKEPIIVNGNPFIKVNDRWYYVNEIKEPDQIKHLEAIYSLSGDIMDFLKTTE